jgi:hypothetical protein
MRQVCHSETDGEEMIEAWKLVAVEEKVDGEGKKLCLLI